MESLYQYIPYLIVAAISWATSSRSNWWIPFLDQINPEPVPVAGLLKRRSLDTILKIVWPFLGDKPKVGLEKCGEVACWIEAECVAADIGLDLALLKLSMKPEGNFPSLLPVGSLTVGEDVMYCGWGGYCPLYLEKSIIQSEDCRLWPAKGRRNFLVGGNGQDGNSGSGIWVKREKGWQLAGVLVAGWSIGNPIICVHPQSLGRFLRDRTQEKAQGGCCERNDDRE